MKFPQSTAVAGNGGLYHGSLTHIDLSTVEFGSTGEFEREKLTMAAAHVLLDCAESTAPPPTPKRKRELWHAPGGRGHEEDENAPPGKRARVLSSKAQEAQVIKSPSPEASGMPKRRTTRANTRRKRATSTIVRGESPAATAGLYMMSGGLQESPPATPGPSNTALPTIAEESSPRASPAAPIKRNSSEKSGSNRAALSKGATNNTTTTESSDTEPKGKSHSKRAAKRTVATGRVSKTKATAKATKDSSRAPSVGLTAENKADSSATRTSINTLSVDPAIKSEFSDAATRTSTRIPRRTEKATVAAKKSSKTSTKAAESANTSEPPQPAVTALTAGSSNSATSNESASSALASNNGASTTTSNSPELTIAASVNAAVTTTTSAASIVSADSGKVRGARGRLVDNKKSAGMKKAWATRRKNGTSGRNGGPPKTETVRKNRQRGFDYGNTGDLHQD